jgi:P27 family predicted phage terminase small subunit
MRGRRPELRAIEGGLLKAPPLPRTLAASMADDWNVVVADLQGRGILTTSMLAVVETYVGAIWVARECRTAIADKGLFAQAKDGQPKPNPALAMLKAAQETVSRLAAELGLTPLSRSRKALQPQPAGVVSDLASEFDV